MAREREALGEGLHEAGTPSGVRDYMLMGLIALLVVTVVLLQDGMGMWSVAPLLLGAVALVTSWSIGPALVMSVLTVLMLFRNQLAGHWRGYYPASDPVTDLGLAAGMLAYTAAQFRLMSLVRRAYPWDWRRPRRKEAGGARSPLLVTGREVLLLLVSVAVFSLVALAGWGWLSNELWYPLLSLPREVWYTVVLIWVFGMGLAIAGALLGYLRWANATRSECLQYLQDQAWAATRGEQRRLNRWLVWARLRAQRRKEEQ